MSEWFGAEVTGGLTVGCVGGHHIPARARPAAICAIYSAAGRSTKAADIYLERRPSERRTQGKGGDGALRYSRMLPQAARGCSTAAAHSALWSHCGLCKQCTAASLASLGLAWHGVMVRAVKQGPLTLPAAMSHAPCRHIALLRHCCGTVASVEPTSGLCHVAPPRVFRAPQSSPPAAHVRHSARGRDTQRKRHTGCSAGCRLHAAMPMPSLSIASHPHLQLEERLARRQREVVAPLRERAPQPSTLQ